MKGTRSIQKMCLTLIWIALLYQRAEAVAQSSNSAELNTSIADAAARQEREDACRDVVVDFRLLSQQEIQVQRNKDINLFHRSTDLLKEIISTEEWQRIFNGDLWLPILISIVFAFSIISVVLYFINIFFCCKRRQTGFADWCVRCNLCLALLAFVIFFVTVIGISVFIASSRTSIRSVNCTIQIMNDDIRNGAYYRADQLRFQGVIPLSKIMTEYGNSLEQLVSQHTTDINDVVTFNLPVLARQALDNVEPFYIRYRDSMTPDGVGNQSRPRSITETLVTARAEMTTEFSMLNNTSLNVHQAASIGKKIIDSGDAQIFRAASEQATRIINEILDNFSDYIRISDDYFGTISKNYDAVQIVYTVFNFVCLIFTLIVLIGLCCAFRSNKCNNFTVWRIMIFIVGLLCLLFFAFTVFVAAVTFFASSSCQIIADLDDPNGIDDFISTFQLDENFGIILKSCYSQDATGDFGEIFINKDSSTSAEFQSYNDAHQMLSVYNQYDIQKASMFTNGNAKSTQRLDDELEKTRIGETLDHSNVQATLTALSNDVSCAGRYYALTPNTCNPSDISNCLIIQNEASYPIPACVAGKPAAEVAASTKRWTDLKAYVTETQTLMRNMIADANGSVQTSLNSLYKTAALKFFDARVIFERVRVTQQPALSLFRGTLSDQLNCRIVNLHIQLIEDALCFNAVGELYSFMVTAVVASFIFFCLVWNLCCAEFCVSNIRDDESANKHAQQNLAPIPTELNHAAEDDFLFEQVKGGYINQSESTPGIAKDRNIEYKIENEPIDVEEDEIPTPIVNNLGKDFNRVNP